MRMSTDEESKTNLHFEEEFLECDDDMNVPELTIAEELLIMMSAFCISHRLMQYLLNLLNKHNVPDIPKIVYQLQKKEL